MQGKVKCEGEVVTKAGMLVPVDGHLTIEEAEERYASRAGLKLEAALTHFNINQITDVCVHLR